MTTRTLKKEIYRLIAKLHDLEKGGKRRERALQKQVDGVPCVVRMLEHLSELLHACLENTQESTIATAFADYVKSLDRLLAEVRANSYSSRPLRKKLVSRFLSKHTSTFDKLIQAGVVLNVDIKKWAKVVYTAVYVWGNKLSVKRPRKHQDDDDAS